ncbi:MAG: DUF3667 domain-containing protein [Pseudomonadota bacterium]|tara:strand:+ start:93 stop:1226 length:1134 start_codon:yes stop_codon:yes gene_type:complete
MTGEIEAAGDALTGSMIAHAVEPASGTVAHDVHGPCANCGAALTGPYCAQCGQAGHIHRSLGSLGHDILHGVFHFEGKVWRTLPELAFHPGRLTRRFIDGQRARFVSPMALFLFTVFLTFAVFGFTGGALLGGNQNVNIGGKDVPIGDWRAGIKEEYARTQKEIDTLQKARIDPKLTTAEKARLDTQIARKIDDRDGMAAVATGDWAKLTELDKRSSGTANTGGKGDGFNASTRWSALDKAVKTANDNPSLLIYKLKTNGYKYSWMLIPLSIPFLWTMYFWRRDIHLYDHAIFATYSISFMLLLLIVLSVGAYLGVSVAIWGLALMIIPPIHMYKQLRGAYGSSRVGSALRLMVLMVSTVIVLTLFAMVLLLLGVLE